MSSPTSPHLLSDHDTGTPAWDPTLMAQINTSIGDGRPRRSSSLREEHRRIGSANTSFSAGGGGGGHRERESSEATNTTQTSRSTSTPTRQPPPDLPPKNVIPITPPAPLNINRRLRPDWPNLSFSTQKTDSTTSKASTTTGGGAGIGAGGGAYVERAKETGIGSGSRMLPSFWTSRSKATGGDGDRTPLSNVNAPAPRSPTSPTSPLFPNPYDNRPEVDLFKSFDTTERVEKSLSGDSMEALAPSDTSRNISTPKAKEEIGTIPSSTASNTPTGSRVSHQSRSSVDSARSSSEGTDPSIPKLASKRLGASAIKRHPLRPDLERKESAKANTAANTIANGGTTSNINVPLAQGLKRDSTPPSSPLDVSRISKPQPLTRRDTVPGQAGTLMKDHHDRDKSTSHDQEPSYETLRGPGPVHHLDDKSSSEYLLRQVLLALDRVEGKLPDEVEKARCLAAGRSRTFSTWAVMGIFLSLVAIALLTLIQSRPPTKAHNVISTCWIISLMFGVTSSFLMLCLSSVFTSIPPSYPPQTPFTTPNPNFSSRSRAGSRSQLNYPPAPLVKPDDKMHFATSLLVFLMLGTAGLLLVVGLSVWVWDTFPRTVSIVSTALGVFLMLVYGLVVASVVVWAADGG